MTWCRGGRRASYDLYGEQPKVWRNLRFARSEMPADAVAVRVVAEDLSLTPEDWIAVTPPRVPNRRSLQEYVGSSQPVLLDWAVGLAFPCQQPMLHVNGVTEIPKFRITPDYTAKKQDTDTWQDGVNGGLLGITDLLLRAHVMSTYLSLAMGPRLGVAAQVRRPREAEGRSAPTGHRYLLRLVVAGADPHQAVATSRARARKRLYCMDFYIRCDINLPPVE